MANPFDDQDAEFLALTRLPSGDQMQVHSLWPAFLDVPRGWSIAFGPAPRAEVLAHISGAATDPDG